MRKAEQSSADPTLCARGGDTGPHLQMQFPEVVASHQGGSKWGRSSCTLFSSAGFLISCYLLSQEEQVPCFLIVPIKSAMISFPR